MKPWPAEAPCGVKLPAARASPLANYGESQRRMTHMAPADEPKSLLVVILGALVFLLSIVLLGSSFDRLITSEESSYGDTTNTPRPESEGNEGVALPLVESGKSTALPHPESSEGKDATPPLPESGASQGESTALPLPESGEGQGEGLVTPTLIRVALPEVQGPAASATPSSTGTPSPIFTSTAQPSPTRTPGVTPTAGLRRPTRVPRPTP